VHWFFYSPCQGFMVWVKQLIKEFYFSILHAVSGF
jgi:hypothetical protein